MLQTHELLRISNCKLPAILLVYLVSSLGFIGGEASVLLMSYIVLIIRWIIKPRSLRDKTSIVHLLHVTAPKRGPVVVFALVVSYAKPLT